MDILYVTRKPSEVCTATMEESGRSRTQTLIPNELREEADRVTDVSTTTGWSSVRTSRRRTCYHIPKSAKYSVLLP